MLKMSDILLRSQCVKSHFPRIKELSFFPGNFGMAGAQGYPMMPQQFGGMHAAGQPMMQQQFAGMQQPNAAMMQQQQMMMQQQAQFRGQMFQAQVRYFHWPWEVWQTGSECVSIGIS